MKVRRGLILRVILNTVSENSMRVDGVLNTIRKLRRIGLKCPIRAMLNILLRIYIMKEKGWSKILNKHFRYMREQEKIRLH